MALPVDLDTGDETGVVPRAPGVGRRGFGSLLPLVQTAWRGLALIFLVLGLPAAVYAAHHANLVRMVLTELGAGTALVLVLVVNVAVIGHVMAMVALWRAIQRDIREMMRGR